MCKKNICVKQKYNKRKYRKFKERQLEERKIERKKEHKNTILGTLVNLFRKEISNLVLGDIDESFVLSTVLYFRFLVHSHFTDLL